MATINALNVSLSGQSGIGTFAGNNGATFTGPILGVPASGILTNGSGLLIGGIAATGTPTSSNFLRGDGTWNATPVPASGTFTPVLNFGGGTTGITYSTNAGEYTAINGMVAFNIYIVLTSKGSATGVASIENLPFTSRNVVPSAIFPLVLINSLFISGSITGSLISNSTEIILDAQSVTDSVGIADTNFTNTSVVYISGTYLT